MELRGRLLRRVGGVERLEGTAGNGGIEGGEADGELEVGEGGRGGSGAGIEEGEEAGGGGEGNREGGEPLGIGQEGVVGEAGVEAGGKGVGEAVEFEVVGAGGVAVQEVVVPEERKLRGGGRGEAGGEGRHGVGYQVSNVGAGPSAPAYFPGGARGYRGIRSRKWACGLLTPDDRVSDAFKLQ